MTARSTVHPDTGLSLALAIVDSSAAPLVLLDGDFCVVAASASFFTAFDVAPRDAAGRSIFQLRGGEWDVPQFRALLKATASGSVQVDAYEMELRGDRTVPRSLVMNVQKLAYGDPEHVRLLLSIADITEARRAGKLKDDLLREKRSCCRRSSTGSPTACRLSPASSCRAPARCSRRKRAPT